MCVIKPAFQMAVDDDLIRKNPFNFQFSTLITNDSRKREALTDEQTQRLLDFVKNDSYYKRYYEGIYILLHTGLRISEFAGLTINDIDLENGIINVNHQLQRRGKTYTLDDTKTTAGTRLIPMIGDVKECFEQIIANRRKPQQEPVIDGVSGFLYLDTNDMPMVSFHWEKYFNRICDKYNKTHDEPLPHVTPHICRHTFISRLAKADINPKALQLLAGHSSIGVTLNVYTHFGFDDVQRELQEAVNQ